MIFKGKKIKGVVTIIVEWLTICWKHQNQFKLLWSFRIFLVDKMGDQLND